MTKVFLSYRRDDTSGHAGRLADRLRERFGSDKVFMDLDQIAPGRDFVEAIDEAIGSCDAVLVLIGKNWLARRGGARRIDNPNDYVRKEIESALSRGVKTVPVVLAGGRMPEPSKLPEEIAPLARINAIELTDARWSYDTSRLMDALAGDAPAADRPDAGETVATPGAQRAGPVPSAGRDRRRLPIRRSWVIGAAIAIVVVAALVIALAGGGSSSSKAAFIEKADAICMDSRAKTAPLQSEISRTLTDTSPQSLKAAAPLLDRLLSALSDTRNRFRALKPPTGGEAALARYVQALDDQIAADQNAAEAARQGDSAKFNTLLSALGDQANRVRAIGRQNGFQVCGQQS